LLADIIGRSPDGFAAPGWRITPQALFALDGFSFRYQSDCRGHSLFRPLVGGRQLSHIQVPTTLPTYDELIGLRCTPETYNDYLLNRIQADRLNVLTIHAEAEGIACYALFKAFLAKAGQQKVVFKPLGDMLSKTGPVAACGIGKAAAAGREGWLACQGESCS
jgi:undecaprenyl phosphate-alpha-L-ara4FN deformylase